MAAAPTRQIVVAAPRRSGANVANLRAKADEKIKQVRASANARVAKMKERGERKVIMYGSAGALGVAERSGALAWVPRVMDDVPNTVTVAGALTIVGALVPGKWGDRIDMAADGTFSATIYALARGMTVSGDIVSGPRKRKRAVRDMRERVQRLEASQTQRASQAQPSSESFDDEGFESEEDVEYV